VKQPRPALLMCPNWMGMRQQAIDRAALLAQDRYVVFAVDMYGEGIRPKDFGEAAALANPLRDDPVEARRRVRGAYDTAWASSGGSSTDIARRSASASAAATRSISRAMAPTSRPS